MGVSRLSLDCGWSPAWRSLLFSGQWTHRGGVVSNRGAGRASAIFNASHILSLFAFGGLFGWLTQKHGWQSCFWFMGTAGLVLAFAWWKTVYNVPDHPLISRPEIDCIEQGGGLVNVDSSRGARRNPLTWSTFKMLLSQRMLVGIYIGQFCITTLTTFFLTWFPSYLVKARHMTILQAGFAASLPALMRLPRRHSRRRVLGRASSPGVLADVCAQSADHLRHAAFGHDDCVQLHQRADAGDGADVAGVFWERIWRAGLDGDCGHIAQGIGGREWGRIQSVRQPLPRLQRRR